ncbi:MAG: arginine deiminase [Acidobacteria bacterium]|nr:arginine deiminase [Acidobacteriota bacterium]
MTRISVKSEIGRLQTVVVHRPGPEVDRMTPTLMNEMLFDDILFGNEARAEHDIFRRVLGQVARVLDSQQMLAEALVHEDARTFLVSHLGAFCPLSRDDEDWLASLTPTELAANVVGGWYEMDQTGRNYVFKIPPIPNLLFMRDPAAVIGDTVSVNHMATTARRSEPLVLETILRYHPTYKVDANRLIWFDNDENYRFKLLDSRNTIEGGDILVLSEHIVAVGVSIRTTQSKMMQLAERLRKYGRFKTLLAVLLPHKRSAMHLDTVFTQIDPEHCLVFPPFMEPNQPESCPVLRVDMTAKELVIELKPDLMTALAQEGHPLKPIRCGGSNRLDQEREQWTDGANAFCLAPGVALAYSRNTRTAEELTKVGYQVVTAEQVLEGGIDVLDGKRYLIIIRGNELSRARGGPRCMTMPLLRDQL